MPFSHANSPLSGSHWCTAPRTSVFDACAALAAQRSMGECGRRACSPPVHVLHHGLILASDRRGADFCLGPTHEEAITDLVASALTSHRQLPWMLYQLDRKFRDEVRLIFIEALSFFVVANDRLVAFRGVSVDRMPVCFLNHRRVLARVCCGGGSSG